MKKLIIILALITAVTLFLSGFTACKIVNKNNGQTNKTASTKTTSIDTFLDTSTSSDPLETEASAADTQASSSTEYTGSVKDFSKLIPEGWTILTAYGTEAKAEGDLNKDNIPDIAAVIEQKASTNTNETKDLSNAAARSLIIAFANPDNSYSLSVKADKAVLLANEGGVFGDPFDSISISRGSVILHFYGGSNWRWYADYRFRFQDRDWYLIGATLGSYFDGTDTPETADEEDYNLLTGDYIYKKKNDSGEMIITKGNRGIKPLVKLIEIKAYFICK
jgi:hypothetical protein